MITYRNARRRFVGRADIRDWPIWRTGVREHSSFKLVSRARYDGDRTWEFPRELTQIIIAYTQEPKMISIPSDGNCRRCDPEEGEPEWPCALHDELQPNPEYQCIKVRDLRIKIIATRFASL